MRRKLLITLLGLALAMPAHAGLEVQRTRLGHGVEAWYAQSSNVPIVDITLTFEGAGNASDPEGKGGLANLVAGMLDEGAGELLAQALTQTALPPESLTQVKTQITSLLSSMQEDPRYHAQKLLTQRAFKNHPYASLSYGTPQSIASLQVEDVRRFMQTYLTRGNLRVSAAGDVDASLLHSMLQSTVEGLAGNDAGAVAVVQTVPQGGGETLTEKNLLPQTVIAFTGPGINRHDKRFYAAYLLNHIIGGGSLTSRLGDALRQKSGLAYSVNTDLDIRRGTALFSGELATRNATSAEALKALKAELAALHTRGVTTEECKTAKSYVIGHFPLQMDRTRAVTALLTSMQLYQLGDDYLEKRVKYFSDVSCADINAVAQELTDPAKLLFVVVGGSDTPAP